MAIFIFPKYNKPISDKAAKKGNPINWGNEVIPLRKLLIFAAIISGFLILTKPSDQTCIDSLKDQINAKIANSNQNSILKGIEEIISDAGSGFAFRIEDNILYKNIYIKGTNKKIGIGILGTVFITTD